MMFDITSPAAPEPPSHYLPRLARADASGVYFLNGRVATGDDDFCVTIFPVEYEGVARLTVDSDPEEFRERRYSVRTVTVSVYQREVPAFQQHKVTLVKGDDLLWRVAPTDNFTADLLFTPTKRADVVPFNVADAVLALYRSQVAVTEGTSIYDDEWDTMAERVEDGSWPE